MLVKIERATSRRTPEVLMATSSRLCSWAFVASFPRIWIGNVAKEISSLAADTVIFPNCSDDLATEGF